MNQYHQIRMYYEQQHKSIRWIARELHCSRDTVRKYIGGDCVPWDRKPGSGRRSVISDEVDRFIDACLAEDERENLRKQKHTAKRIHDRIRQELGIEIGESTIRGVVAKKREKQKPVFVPLAFDPSEAITACCTDYNQTMLELNALPTGETDPKQDIPVCRTDLSRYDRLLGRRDAV